MRPAAFLPASSQLPLALSTFVGREQELDAAEAHLAGTRLLTLTGAGGSGKTRLAIELARRLEKQYAVAWIELAPLLEAELLTAYVGAALGIVEEGGRPLRATLLDALRGRELLLVLDNCEHLVDACAELATTILRACPGVRILATSREALGIDGERARLVTGLEEAEASRLFERRAQAVLSSFTLNDRNADAVKEICRRVDGLPLAIELAAARVRVLTPEQIATKLEQSFNVLASRGRGMPTRHQTLRATVDWSYQLASRDERVLLRRLSVFAGGFTLDAVEAVCAGDDLAADAILDLLTGLVDKSLAAMRERDGTARYELLEQVRQYAADHLAAKPDDQERTRRAHAEFYVSLAEAALPYVEQATEGEWPQRLVPEQDNFRLILAWSIRADAPAAVHSLGIRLIAALWWFWGNRAQYAEGRVWLEQAVSLIRGRAPEQQIASVLFGAGSFALLHGDMARARPLLEQSVAMWEQLPPSHRHTMAESTYAYLLAAIGEAEAARLRVEASLARARRLPQPWIAAYAWMLAGLVYSKLGDLERAEDYLATAEDLAKRIGYLYEIAEGTRERAWIALQRRDLGAAVEHIGVALEACARLAEAYHSFRGIIVCAAVAVAVGQPAVAVRLLGVVAAMRESTRGLLIPIPQRELDQLFESARTAAGDEVSSRESALGRAMNVAEAVAFAASAMGHSAGTSDRIIPRATSGAPALHVRALGALHIERAGVTLASDAWSYARPRELLLYLLSHPEGRSRDQIGVVFWPEASAAQVKNNFHVTLHHMRKALGISDIIVFEEGRYRANWELGIEFDAVTFERELPRAMRTARETHDSGCLRETLALYRGDFLDDVTVGDWHLEMRDRLRRLQVDGLLALGALLDGAARWSESAEVYRKLVSQDTLHEEGYRRLMTSLVRSGDRGEAMRIYDRLVTLLRADFEMEPEAKTTALRDRVRTGADV